MLSESEAQPAQQEGRASRSATIWNATPPSTAALNPPRHRRAPSAPSPRGPKGIHERPPWVSAKFGASATKAAWDVIDSHRSNGHRPPPRLMTNAELASSVLRLHGRAAERLERLAAEKEAIARASPRADVVRQGMACHRNHAAALEIRVRRAVAWTVDAREVDAMRTRRVSMSRAREALQRLHYETIADQAEHKALLEKEFYPPKPTHPLGRAAQSQLVQRLHSTAQAEKRETLRALEQKLEMAWALQSLDHRTRSAKVIRKTAERMHAGRLERRAV